MSRWPLARLGEVAEVVDCEHKTAPAAEPRTEYGYSVGTPHIRDGCIEYASAKRVTLETCKEWSRRAELGAGDLILAREAPVGQVGRVDADRPTCLGQRTVLVRADSARVVERYLHAYLLGRDAQQWMEDRSTGSTVAHLNVADVREIPVALPPLDEQRRIAGVLGALDDIIKTNRQLRQDSLGLARATYDRAVEASDVEVSLRECGRWLSGGTPSTSNPTYWSGDIPWISASSLHSFFLTSSDRQVTVEGAANGTRLVPAGSILFVVRGMSLKSEFRVGVAQREVAFGQDCKAIIVNKCLPKATIAVGLLAASDSVLDMVDEASHGTGRLQSDRIEALPIRLPAERQLAAIENALAALLAAGAAAEDEIADLTQARDELLPLLMSGRVRVRRWRSGGRDRGRS